MSKVRNFRQEVTFCCPISHHTLIGPNCSTTTISLYSIHHAKSLYSPTF
uniref:Uncharacterized protein n=1 Tax=Rhizophora mucronata TaxID=61149 RepID=A0A2P2IK57_RHIMU